MAGQTYSIATRPLPGWEGRLANFLKMMAAEGVFVASTRIPVQWKTSSFFGKSRPRCCVCGRATEVSPLGAAWPHVHVCTTHRQEATDAVSR